MSTSPKTVFCDIDGTILEHTGDVYGNLIHRFPPLKGVKEQFKLWDTLNYHIVLTTGRKESSRKETEKQLLELGITYDELIMGLPNGDRILINDKKPRSDRNTAYAINLVRNSGMEHLSLHSKNVTCKDYSNTDIIEKPWGYEKLIEYNDKYVVKKLFMKAGHSCSTQYHEMKKETIVVFSGKLTISIGKTLDTLEHSVYGPGDSVSISPYTIHKMEAIEDSIYYESSTNELHDVVRLADSYGRI